MKYVTVREIEANDCRREYNPIVPVVVVLALAAVTHLFMGCGDGSDMDEPSEEKVAEARGTVDPYEPEHSEQALVSGLPDYVWTSGLLQPYGIADAADWSIRTGGMNKWGRKSIAFGVVGSYQTAATYATIGRPLRTGAKCVLVGSYSNGYMNCDGIAYKCPKAAPPTPTGVSDGVASPKYTFGTYYKVSSNPVLTYAQFYRSGDSIRCDYSLAGVAIQVVTK